MPIIGTNIASSVAGAANAERVAAKAIVKREAGLRPGARRGDKDELIVGAEATERAEEVRSLKSNDQEEAREDHRQHAAYSTKGPRQANADRPNLDMQA